MLIITHGGNVTLALEAAEKFFIEEELLVNICVLSSVKPIDKEFILPIVKKDIQIGVKHKPFIIAEMSGNHNNSLEKSIEDCKKASEAGVHAIKLQTYTADTITLNIKKAEFLINDKNSLWNGKNLYDLYDQAHTPWDWHEIMSLANKLGLICFSSPFDETAVDFLEDLNVPAYKIASFESSHLPLIKKEVVLTGKPLILSTGMASFSNLGETVNTIKELGCKNLILLKCTSNYPANPKNSNILTIPHMRDLFNCEVGLSDHTMGIGTSIASIAHGASVIEKHFTLDRSDGVLILSFAEPSEMQKFSN